MKRWRWRGFLRAAEIPCHNGVGCVALRLSFAHELASISPHHAGVSPRGSAIVVVDLLMNRMITKVIHGDWLVRKHFVPLSCGIVLLITTFTLSFIPTSAFAEETPKMGFYASLGLDLSEDSFDKYPDDPDFETGIGFALTVGYRFHPNIAAEGTCEYLNRVDSDDFDPDLEASILSFHGNLKGYLTTTRFQPFVLLGAGVTRFRFEQSGSKRDDDVGITGHFGGGFDYYIAPRISVGLTAAYVATSGKIEDLDYSTFTLGAQYRF